MQLRPKHVNKQLWVPQKATSYVAERHACPVMYTSTQLFQGMDNIYDVPDEVCFYTSVAALPGVSLIGEIGFNAGHSAIVLLSGSPGSKLITFDIENLAHAEDSLCFVWRISWAVSNVSLVIAPALLRDLQQWTTGSLICS